ncbi:MAG: endonuclease VII domain-containing protein [Actinomycetota bacterium]|nr:endonuclease VII domain-containing protein [Actinomycetota bacterium]
MRCPDCSQDKSPEEFPRNKGKKSGRGTYCKTCHNRRGRETVKRLHGDSRHYHFKQRYGIGVAEVKDMIAAQGGLCPICQKRPAVHVDHDHASGSVRGILCEPCNGGIGQFKDHPGLIEAAIAYLRRASCVPQQLELL